MVQFAQLKEWKGDISLSNSLFATRIFFNTDFEEARALKDRFLPDSGRNKRKFSEQLSSRSSFSRTEQFLQVQDRKSLDEIVDASSPMVCTTLATIVSVKEGRGWFYPACKTCNKKVKDEDMYTYEGTEGKLTKFSCNKCINTYGADHIVPRDVTSILHMTASDLRLRCAKPDDESTLPDELGNLVGKRCIFRVEVSTYNLKNNYEVFTVLRLTDNVDLIKSFLCTSADNLEILSCMGDTEGTSNRTPLKSCVSEENLADDHMSTTKERKLEVKIEKI